MSKSGNEPKLPIPFTPVQLRYRRDGWTAERQVVFIEALAEGSCFEEACRRVGMSDSSAYKLALRHPAFAEACDAAIDFGMLRVEHAAHARSRHGVARPIFYKGEQVGEWRHHDERLTMKQRRMSGRHPQPCPPDRAFCFIFCERAARNATANGSSVRPSRPTLTNPTPR